ncbi:hypothetical protein PilKf_02485 [Pillotina sp. SPG140]|jgi:uncharacterized membrane protein
MLRYIVQVIENISVTGIFTALLWALLEGSRRTEHRRRTLLCSSAGLAAALLLAVLRRTTAINRAFINVWTSVLILVAGILFILFQWGLLQKTPLLKKHSSLCETASDYTSAVLAGLILFYSLPTIFLYPTEFALTGESIFSTDFLFKMIGYIAGLTVAGLSFFALFQSARKLPVSILKILLSLMIAANTIVHAVAVTQFLLVRRLIPMNRLVFKLVVAVINNNSLFLYAYMALSFLLPLSLFFRSFKSSEPYSNPAQLRKIRSGLRSNRRWCITVTVGFALSVFCLSFVKTTLERGVVLSPAEPMTIAGTEILIPIERVADGHLHRFAFTASDGTEVRFIVIKKNEAAYGVGLDACDICGATGYYERKNQVICRLCDVVMNISTIGFKGGCNPVPLVYFLRDGNMVVTIEHLESEKSRFQ